MADQRLSIRNSVENSLSDLLSQFEFLNPGMCGYGRLSEILEDVKLNRETLGKLREIFKPFILRRTKQQVAKELPPKIDQVVYCEMDEGQKEIYERLWRWYRQELLEKEKKTSEAGKKWRSFGRFDSIATGSMSSALISEEWSGIPSTKIRNHCEIKASPKSQGPYLFDIPVF